MRFYLNILFREEYKLENPLNTSCYYILQNLTCAGFKILGISYLPDFASCQSPHERTRGSLLVDLFVGVLVLRIWNVQHIGELQQFPLDDVLPTRAAVTGGVLPLVRQRLEQMY